MRSLSRELILPALRLQVPDRPGSEHVQALADLSAEEWTTRPADWLTGQLVRLAVAEVLAARFDQVGGERTIEETTVAQAAGLFRPHVDLAAQAFRVAVTEAVNAGVPAITEPLREALRQLGVTGRDRLWMLALGLDKVPPRARGAFWSSVKGSVGVTALLDALAEPGTDLTALDPAELARADAVVQAGGRTIAVVFDQQREQGASWLSVPLTISRTLAWRGVEPRLASGVTLTLGSGGWAEVHDTALSAVGAAMAGIDLGGIPRGRAFGLAAVVADRLAAARDRTLADLVASLRAVHPAIAEAYSDQVRTPSARVAIATVEEDHFAQLWLPTSALAGPLVTGGADLYLGGRPVVRGGRPDRRPARPVGRPEGRAPGRQGRPDEGRSGGRPSGGGRRGRGKRPDGPAPPTTPVESPPPSAPESAPGE